MILELQFPRFFKSPSGTRPGWVNPIVVRKIKFKTPTREKIRWSETWCFLFSSDKGRKEKLPQTLFFGYSLNKICFQAETQCVLPQATIYVHLSGPQRASISLGTGHRAKPWWSCLASPHARGTPSCWSPVAMNLHQASCYKWLVLCGEFCRGKRPKMTSSTHSRNWEEGVKPPLWRTWWRFPGLWLVMGNT